MEPLTGEVFLEPHDKQRYFTLCFVGLGLRTHRHAALILSFPVPLRASGKEKIMKTPIEFDYDLWTTEDGKCMVRVKSTGEVTEVDRDVMRLLRAEEKKLRRSMTGVPISGCEDETATLLTLDYVSYQSGEDMAPAWAEDVKNYTDETITNIMLEDFKHSLSDLELSVFECCMMNGMTVREYALRHKISKSYASKIKNAIREKIKNFFEF